MSKVLDGASCDDVLKFISRSSSYGNLGLFVGAGFTKAVLNDKREVALSWGDLLARTAEKLGVDYKAILSEGAAYPEIASRICREHSKAKGLLYSESLSQLKRVVADLTCWYPDQKRREKFSPYLDALSPAWIITTNYDLAVEALLTGRSIALGPRDTLSSPRGIIPVYHLHGARTHADDIIIAQEDYVALFRPTQYRQIKLALTVRESTTLLLGYSLGDVNVLTALDWSTKVFQEDHPTFPRDVIQVVRKKKPNTKPYRDESGILIVETQELAEFFEDFCKMRKAELAREETENAELAVFAKELAEADADLLKRFVDERKFRADLIDLLSDYRVELISSFLSLLDKGIDETWKRSAPSGAFEPYAQNLAIILDILEKFDVQHIPPALFQSAANALDRLAPMVGHTFSQSYAAGTLWNSRKGKLKAETVRELRNIADQHSYTALEMLLDTI